MKTICAWCGLILDGSGDYHVADEIAEPVSHGLCPKCFEEMEANGELELPDDPELAREVQS